MNASIPRFECLLRDEFMYNMDARVGVTPVVVFGVASLPGQATLFHALLKNGAMVGRLPISAFRWKPDAPLRPNDELQLWNNFSYNVEAIEYDFLEGMRCEVILRDRDVVGGAYLFTLDWYGSVDSEDVGDLGWKCGHVIRLDDGNFTIQPNNRIRWATPSFTDLTLPWPPDYRTINQIWSSETQGRWAIQGDGAYFEVHSK